MFADKLDLIMRVTSTRASALGRACMLNAAHVSRLRCGTRGLPKRPAFLHDMCAYLAKRVTEDYQRSVLCGALRVSVWPSDERKAAELIEGWFLGREEPSSEIARLLASFGNPPSAASAIPEKPSRLPTAKSYYYGSKGKQEAVLQFFDLILKEKATQTLLLSSEEELGWIFDDPAFAARWSAEFLRTLEAGNQVKIIHSIGRNMHEMLEAVARWLPIYMTGMIEPYYYPKLRDGIFRRTLFLAPKTAAVVSVSVGRNTEGMLNELIVDREAVAALREEFMHSFALCRPLMQIMTAPKRNNLRRALNALLKADGDVICMSDLPTLATMPAWVAKAMQKRAPESSIVSQRKVMTHWANNLPDGVCYREILPSDLQKREPPELPCADLLGAPGLRYTPEEWKAHLAVSSRFAGRNSAYRQSLRADFPKNVCVFVKEGRGGIVMKSSAPGVAFAFSEANMVNAFWSYLSGKV